MTYNVFGGALNLAQSIKLTQTKTMMVSGERGIVV